MSGIAGVMSMPPRSGEEMEAWIGPMLAAIAHRGPDAEGKWTEPKGRCALGHRLAATIDIETLRQPMLSADGKIAVTLDGSIYNHEDIARELRQKGHRFRTRTDTEVLIEAYREWGPACVERFNGSWALGLWDTDKEMLLCSRDRLGSKPFYYCWDGKTFAFASEVKALIAAGLVQPALNPDGLRQYLTFQYCTGPTTFFQGVHRLEGAHNLTLKAGGEPTPTRYWDVSFEIDEEHDEDWFVDRLEALLQDSVRLCLNTDETIGVSLSGGLDSSTVVCLTRMLLGEDAPIKTFTGAFNEGKEYDERPFAKLVAKEARTEYLELIITSRDFADCIERVMYLMDEPAAGPGVFSEYLVARFAGKHAKVVLNGEGGDEFFLGYARYLIAYLEECLKGAIEDTASRGHYVATLGTIVPNLPMLQNYVPMLRSFWAEGLFEEPVKRYYRLLDRFSASKSLLARGLQVDTKRTFDEFRAIFESHGAAAKINRIMNVEIKTSLAALLHVDDCVSAAWGLDGRSPLLDHRLLELMACVPPVIKFRNGNLKYLFRLATKNILPKEIRERRDKMGFPAPLGMWIKNELRDFFHDVLLGDKARARGIFDPAAIEKILKSDIGFSREIWGALCVELWHRLFMDGNAKSYLPQGEIRSCAE